MASHGPWLVSLDEDEPCVRAWHLGGPPEPEDEAKPEPEAEALGTEELVVEDVNGIVVPEEVGMGQEDGPGSQNPEEETRVHAGAVEEPRGEPCGL